MKPMTEEQRQALIEFIGAAFDSMKGNKPVNQSRFDIEKLTQDVFEIALASLIAEPKAYAVSNNFWNTPDSVKNLNDMHCDLFFPGAVYRGQEFNPENYDHCVSLYTAPPVPVIKLPDVKELPCWVNDDDDFLRWYESETKRLNGLGE